MTLRGDSGKIGEEIASQNRAFPGEWQVERGEDFETAYSTEQTAKEWR